MADDRQLNTDPIKPWTRRDEENLLLEISEDERLVRLGIDPDEHPLLVLLKLKEKQRALQKARLEKQVPAPDKSEK